MAANVKEIARRAGVSVATVSRVIHQSEKVQPDTRQQVEAVIKEMGLEASQLVRAAKTDKRVVGVLVPDLSNTFFIEIIAGVEAVAREMGIGLFICHTHEDDQEEIHCLRLLKETQVCGIIITPSSDDDDSINNEYLNLLGNMKIPIVLVDRDVKYTNFDGVFIDNERGAFSAAHLLLEQGHQHIACIGGPQNTTPGRGREQGYRSAFALAGRPVEEELMYYGDFSRESGQNITRNILEKHPEVTAIFSANNLMTLGCLIELKAAGKTVPQDMAVVGFDDIPLLNMLGIPLTVVKRSTQEMGRQAMKLLCKQLAGKEKKPARRITLMPELILRGSELGPASRTKTESEESKT